MKKLKKSIFSISLVFSASATAITSVPNSFLIKGIFLIDSHAFIKPSVTKENNFEKFSFILSITVLITFSKFSPILIL